MFKTILVCSDGSEHAMEAARQGAEIARRFGSRVVLLDVFDTSFLTTPSISLCPVGIDAGTLEHMMDQARTVAGKRTVPILKKAGIAYEEVYETGEPGDCIVQTAASEHANLVVLGSRGSGAWTSLLGGRVSDEVLHGAPCPVLIARGTCGTTGFRHILLATDGSERAIKATKIAAALAAGFGAVLTAEIIVKPQTTSPDNTTNADPATDVARQREQVRQDTERIVGEAGITPTLREDSGHPAAETIHAAEEEGADLIVLGCQCFRAHQSMFLGSVSDRVTHHAHCAVLVAR